jgi:hypothetical protein
MVSHAASGGVDDNLEQFVQLMKKRVCPAKGGFALIVKRGDCLVCTTILHSQNSCESGRVRRAGRRFEGLSCA